MGALRLRPLRSSISRRTRISNCTAASREQHQAGLEYTIWRIQPTRANVLSRPEEISRIWLSIRMSSFGRRNNNGHSYIMNPQIALPVPYSHGDGHEFGGNGPGSFGYHQSPYSSYGHFSSPYSHQSSLSTGTQHFTPHYSSGHSTPDQVRLHHQPSQYITQSRYLQSPRYLPLRDALNETEVESQESTNEGTMLSEPVVPDRKSVV